MFNDEDSLGTIAGCFWVAAIDSLMPGPDGELRRNESLGGDTVCVDNCPFYFLPNVFSPNADDENDLFRPFPWKFVDSVHVVIHNRWGEAVFETNNPDVLWDGTYLDTGERLPDGVYFYTVVVFTRRLEGLSLSDSLASCICSQVKQRRQIRCIQVMRRALELLLNHVHGNH